LAFFFTLIAAGNSVQPVSKRNEFLVPSLWIYLSCVLNYVAHICLQAFVGELLVFGDDLLAENGDEFTIFLRDGHKTRLVNLVFDLV
jgi:hypothetical protein